jgi:heme oxygenase
MTETKAEAHRRLQTRTRELHEEHAALALSRKPFDQRDHDQHSADLTAHKKDLAIHKAWLADSRLEPSK